MIRAGRVGLAGTASAILAACLGCGGPKTVAKDGYRALLVFSPEEQFAIAVRGEMRRVEGDFEGSRLIKVVRPDLGKSWQFRPSTEKIYETRWSPTDEIVPGYPLEPGFDPEAYADRFGGVIHRIDDAVHGLHPCERFEMMLPSRDRVTIWVARDLDRLAVRIEHARPDSGDEYQPFTDTQLLDVRPGAPEKLFLKPEGFAAVTSYEALAKPQSRR